MHTFSFVVSGLDLLELLQVFVLRLHSRSNVSRGSDDGSLLSLRVERRRVHSRLLLCLFLLAFEHFSHRLFVAPLSDHLLLLLRLALLHARSKILHSRRRQSLIA